VRRVAEMQHWRFLVVGDPKVKEMVGALYKRAWDERVVTISNSV